MIAKHSSGDQNRSNRVRTTRTASHAQPQQMSATPNRNDLDPYNFYTTTSLDQSGAILSRSEHNQNKLNASATVN